MAEISSRRDRKQNQYSASETSPGSGIGAAGKEVKRMRAGRTSTVLGSLGWIGGVHDERRDKRGPMVIVSVHRDVDGARRNHARRSREGREKNGHFGAREAALAETELDLLGKPDDLTFNGFFTSPVHSSSTHPFTWEIMDSEADAAPESFFRPVKRRKFMRKRPDDRHVSEDTSGAHEAAVVNRAQDHRPDETKYTGAEGDEEQTTGVVRLRRPHVARKGGIGFSTMSGLGKDDHRQTALAPAEDHENEKVQAMCDRFTGHTGQTVDVDKHMYGPPSTTPHYQS